MPKPTGTTTFAPRPEHPAPPLVTDDPREAYDSLAELFLGEIGRRRNPHAQPGAAAADDPDDAPALDLDTVEGLILGHLPVLGSAWVSQYARCVAHEEAVTVGLVQLRAGYATVEVVPADDDDLPPQPLQARASLAAAINAAAAVAGRWIIRVEEPDEPLLATHPRISALTLLTSADEFAIVAAYRTLKRLLTDPGADRDDPDDRPEVRVSVMGAPDDAADAVFAKLSEAARMFVQRPIERAPGVHRVSTAGGPSVVLFSGPVEGAARLAIDAITSATRRRRAPRPAARPERTLRLTLPEEPPQPAAPSSPQPVPVDAAPPQASPPAHRAGHLAGHLNGLTPLAITCPYAPQAQFAAGADGRLHILASQPDAATAALEPLTVAAAWATAHAPLLRAAVGGAPLELPPTLHLFVDQPRDVRRLLDADIRIHLLAPATVGGRVQWLCRDLN